MRTDVETQALLQENQLLREQLQFYRECDRLTGLWNKNTFCQKVTRLFAEHPTCLYDIVCVDVERFKLVNDLYGIEQGDDLLRYLARELAGAYPDVLLSRISNDVFALCLPREMEGQLQEQILDIFRRYPFDMTIIPAIGVYRVEDPSLPVSLMCDWAMLALGSIKGNYLNHVAVYDMELRNMLLMEQEILNDVEGALEDRQFEFYLQPKVNMRTGKVVGAEALVRWNHPQRGLIPPNNFIPIFERNGFIKKLDVYIWEEVTAWQRRWLDAGHPALPISVNLSRIDVFGMDVTSVLEDLLQRYHLDPDLLELEITESAYVNQPEVVIHTIDRLMGHGFTVLMDDFGSGYSSLNMLKDISVDVLKIDMRFLERDNQKSKDILESVVQMGKWLNLPVIAEGVQTQSQVEFLQGIGCLYAQGFFYYRPMPVADYEALLLDGTQVDFEDGGKLQNGQEMYLDLHDLFHKDAMSDHLLGNILGAVALYDYDGSSLHLVRANEQYYLLTGRIKDLPSSKEDLMQAVYPDDLEKMKALLRAAKHDTQEEGVETEIRRQWNNGPVHWLQIHLFHLSSKGEQDIFYASLHDVTEQREAIEQLRISEQRFRLAMEATNTILFNLDLKTRKVYFSEYAQKTYGLSANSVDGPEGFIEGGTICEDSQEEFRAIYAAIFRGEKRASAYIHSRQGDGSIVWNRITLTAIEDQQGETVQALGMVEMVCGDGPRPT